MSDERNAREQLAAAAEWLGWQDEDMSAGLKSAEDGLKLWKYWQAVVAPALTPDSYTIIQDDYRRCDVVAPALTPDSYTKSVML